MIILLIIAAWIVVFSLVAGLCAAARVGDAELLTRAYAPTAAGQVQPLAWEPAQHVEIYARAAARPRRNAHSLHKIVTS